MGQKAAIEVLEIHPPARCAWCSGAGQMLVSPGAYASCIVCGGKGIVLIGLPAITCTECQGSGKRKETRTCFTCRGSGWERNLNPG